MPRTGKANQRVRDERKAQILEAALKVFAHEGLADTKIADIASAANVSHGLVYHYFTSKEEVFATLVERAVIGTARIAQEALEQPGTAWEKICWLTKQILPGLRDQPEYSMVVLCALTNKNVPQSLRGTAWQQAETIRSLMRQLIVEGQNAGEVVAGDADQLSVLYLSCLQGLAIIATFLDPLIPIFPDVDVALYMLKNKG